MMNKQKGNMYGWVTHTWNPIKGKCPHDCSYCYMKVFPQGELRFDEKCMKDDLGQDNVIFVGSSTDMFAYDIKDEWILKVLEHCRDYPRNRYLFQSKNPEKFIYFFNYFPLDTIFGTTLESDIEHNVGNAPFPAIRVMELCKLSENIPKMISIEPIMDFNLDLFTKVIKKINPKFVSIGADSKGHNLPEPSWDKVQQLITELKKFTEVKIKDNLKRLRG